MSEIEFFDANCQVGRFNFRAEGVPYTVAALADDMERQSIGHRLVHHAMAKEYSPAVGNERLMAAIEGRPGLHACWAVSTWVTGEMPPPGELIAQLRAHDVRAVRFFSEAYSVPWAEWSLGPLWSALETHRVPLVLDVGDRWATMDPFDTEPVYQLCHSHPNLPVILVKHRIRFNRQVYQLLEACPNLCMELSGYWHYRALEEICGRFGDRRLLFGTNWPYMDSAFAVAAVTYAQVADETKAAVAGGTLQEFMEGVRW